MKTQLPAGGHVLQTSHYAGTQVLQDSARTPPSQIYKGCMCPVMWTYHICAFDTSIDKMTLFCNDVNKTSTSVEIELLAIKSSHREVTWA